VEHKVADDHEGDVIAFDPNYVNQMSPPSVKHRAAFLEVDDKFEQCSIASTLLGQNSPYVALFVTKDAYAKERREVIMNVLALIAVAIGDSIGRVPPPRVYDFPGFVRVVMINRNTGEYWEDVGVSTPHSCELGDVLLRHVIAKALDAVVAGYTVLMWCDGLFRFAHQLVFIDENGAVLVAPEGKLRNQRCGDEREVSYEQMAADLWPKKNRVVVFQLMSVYLATVEPVVIEQENMERLRAWITPRLNITRSATFVGGESGGMRRTLTRSASVGIETGTRGGGGLF
jgi:hypothetical protein